MMVKHFLDREYDAVILGAGPAGSAAALKLCQLGVRKILLAEASHFEIDRIGESIPPDSRQLLAELDLLADFLAENHEPCLGSCSSWGDEQLGYNDFMLNLYGHGWHLDRTRFDMFMADQAEARGAVLQKGLRFSKAEKQATGGYRLSFSTQNKQPVETLAPTVIDATGRNRAFAHSQGAKPQYDDRLLTVAATFKLKTTAKFDKLTLLESCNYGWWYAARLSDHKAVVAVTSDPKIVKQRALAAPQSWLWHLARTQHLGHRLHGSKLMPTTLKAYSAFSFRLDQISGLDWLAVGDTAASYDPITSQGIYKALLTGIQAAEAVKQKLEGKTTAFSDYEARLAQRYQEYLSMRQYLYNLEQRWADEPFWRQRQVISSN